MFIVKIWSLWYIYDIKIGYIIIMNKKSIIFLSTGKREEKDA